MTENSEIERVPYGLAVHDEEEEESSFRSDKKPSNDNGRRT